MAIRHKSRRYPTSLGLLRSPVRIVGGALHLAFRMLCEPFPLCSCCFGEISMSDLKMRDECLWNTGTKKRELFIEVRRQTESNTRQCSIIHVSPSVNIIRLECEQGINWRREKWAQPHGASTLAQSKQGKLTLEWEHPPWWFGREC